MSLLDDAPESDSNESKRAQISGSSGLGGLAAGCAVVLIATFGSFEATAQDLPSASELESEDSGGSSPFEEAESSGTDENDENDEQASSESASAESSGTSSESGETNAESRQKTNEQDESERAAKSGEPSPEAEGKAAAEKTAETAKKAANGGDDNEEDKPGEIVETETDVERTVEGRGSAEGDMRWVQTGLNAYGAPGLQHLASATPRKSNTYDVAFFGEVSGGSSVVRAQDNNNFVGGRFLIHAQPIEYFSANLALGASNNVNQFGRPEAMLSQGDLSLGLRGHYPATEYVSVAADVNLDVPTGFGSAGLDFAGTSVTPRLLGTLDVNPLVEGTEVPLQAHLNFGYRVDNSSNTVPGDVNLTRVERFAYGISEYHAVELGLGFEYDVPYVSPFASWNIDFPTAGPGDLCDRPQSLQCVQTAGFGAYPNKISFGLKGEPVQQLALHAGVDVSLTSQDAAGIPVTPPYKVFLGASWQIDPRARVEKVTKTVEKTRLVKEMPDQGRIVGKLKNKKTEMPVGDATISYPESDRSAQMAGSESGTFRSYGFEPGEKVTVRISHPNFETTETKVAVEKGEKTVEFALEPSARLTNYSGKVTGSGGEPISGAQVVFDGPQTKLAKTDGSGKFNLEIKTGSYTVGVSAPDYVAVRKSVEVKPDGSASASFSLERGGNASLVAVENKEIKIEERVAFATGTAKIDQDSHEILDAVANRLRARPDFDRIEVQGHTDDVGSKSDNMELSEKRAKSVVDYLADQGISRDRLVGKGYGPTQPLVPNISDRNRRMNRRVEFKILEK